MEFADVGDYCSIDHCKQQDFFPFQCNFCGDVFCKDHRRPSDHKCQNGGENFADDNYIIICPLCEGRVSLKGTAQLTYDQKDKIQLTPDIIWQEHIESGACEVQKKQNEEDKKKNKLPS